MLPFGNAFIDRALKAIPEISGRHVYAAIVRDEFKRHQMVDHLPLE
jgi:hypothetical protein